MNRLDLKFLLKALLSVLALGAVLKWAGLGALADVWKRLDANWVLLALGLFFPAQLLGAYRWHVLLTYLDCALPFPSVLRYHLLGQVAALVLPGQVSGDFVRMAALTAGGNQGIAVVLSVAIDKGILLVVLFAFAVMGLVVPGPWSQLPGALLVASVCLLISAGAIVLLCRARSRRIIDLCLRLFGWLPQSARRRLGSVLTIVRVRQVSYVTMGLCLMLALCFQIANSVGTYLLARSLQIAVNPFDWLAITAVVSLVQILPITIGGLGVREGALAAILSFYAVSGATATALSLLGFGLVAILLVSGWLLVEVINARLVLSSRAPNSPRKNHSDTME